MASHGLVLKFIKVRSNEIVFWHIWPFKIFDLINEKMLYWSKDDFLFNFQDELPGSSFTDVVPHPEDQQELKSILRQVNAKDANREGKKKCFSYFIIYSNLTPRLEVKNRNLAVAEGYHFWWPTYNCPNVLKFPGNIYRTFIKKIKDNR